MRSDEGDGEEGAYYMRPRALTGGDILARLSYALG